MNGKFSTALSSVSACRKCGLRSGFRWVTLVKFPDFVLCMRQVFSWLFGILIVSSFVSEPADGVMKSPIFDPAVGYFSDFVFRVVVDFNSRWGFLNPVWEGVCFAGL